MPTTFNIPLFISELFKCAHLCLLHCWINTVESPNKRVVWKMMFGMFFSLFAFFGSFLFYPWLAVFQISLIGRNFNWDWKWTLFEKEIKCKLCVLGRCISHFPAKHCCGEHFSFKGVKIHCIPLIVTGNGFVTQFFLIFVN